ncbi:hypothetical protein K461DRAFT_291991 [Myriangium duriaei CBS 260.36]|uniref:Transcription initiation factor TFIID subunit 8 n=1 Tax=Myriangium duriaei CBS 260.36 TaxID=1168546 RepID=A0A9P4J5R2_9PEZI|nr:hypothetical protein K461DRAFT_291991 [Myriangium duriaei CBS 260.36]
MSCGPVQQVLACLPSAKPALIFSTPSRETLVQRVYSLLRAVHEMDSADQASTKRRQSGGTQHHGLSNIQSMPLSTEPAVQDPFFTQLQFDKGISAMLAVAGFDGVTASALHSFKALAEEYIVGFLETVGMSMLASRRNLPIPQDFVLALAQSGISPSQLEGHISLKIPKDISAPVIVAPAADEPPLVELRDMLGPTLCGTTQFTHPQIPSHFPPLPSKHTWMDTQHVAAREKDPRKIRERATQEGILAEQALRKLAAAANKPRSRSQRTASTTEKNKQAIWQDALAAIIGDDVQNTQGSNDVDISMTDGADDQVDEKKGTPKQSDRTAMVINYDRAHWRKGASFGSIRS